MSSLLMLIYKDFSQQCKRIITNCIIMFLLSAITGIEDDGIGVIVGMVSAIGMASLMSSVYEDENGGLTFLRSLPLPPAVVVAGKFISNLLLYVLYIAMAVIPLLIINPENIQVKTVTLSVFLSAGVGLMLAGAMLAIFYRKGYQAVRGFFFGCFIVIMCLGTAIKLVTEKLSIDSGAISQWVLSTGESLVQWADRTPIGAVSACIAIFITLYTSCAIVATGWLGAREL